MSDTPTSRRGAPKEVVPAAMRSGIRGGQVKDLQVLLRDRGLYDREVDGYYSNYVRNAVYKLQVQLGSEGHQVRPSGTFDAATVAVLSADTGQVGLPASESSPPSSATRPTAESDPGSPRTDSSPPSRKRATKSSSSSRTASSRTRSTKSK